MLRPASAAVAAALLLGACAAPPPARSPFRDPAMTATRATQALAVGRPTKAEARSLRGAPEPVPVESGYEAWVYRGRGDGPPREELVLLFDATGVLAKQRVRAAGPATAGTR